VTRDADREPDLDRACARYWQPVEAPDRRREPKYRDEPVQRSSEAPTDTSGLDPDLDSEPKPELDVDPNRERPRIDPAARAHDTQERDYAERLDRGDVELDVGGRHG
jgi:hypothetical protein